MATFDQPINSYRCTFHKGVGIGPFSYGSEENQTVEQFQAELVEPPFASCTWRTYEVEELGVQLYFDDEEDPGLNGIGCFKSFEYRGSELVGLNYEEIVALMGHEEESENEPDGRISLEYCKLGLQVWLGVDGKCESVMCNPPVS